MRRSRVSKDRWGNLKRIVKNKRVARATMENYFGQPHKPKSVVHRKNRNKLATFKSMGV